MLNLDTHKLIRWSSSFRWRLLHFSTINLNEQIFISLSQFYSCVSKVNRSSVFVLQIKKNLTLRVHDYLRDFNEVDLRKNSENALLRDRSDLRLLASRRFCTNKKSLTSRFTIRFQWISKISLSRMHVFSHSIIQNLSSLITTKLLFLRTISIFIDDQDLSQASLNIEHSYNKRSSLICFVNDVAWVAAWSVFCEDSMRNSNQISLVSRALLSKRVESRGGTRSCDLTSLVRRDLTLSVKTSVFYITWTGSYAVQSIIDRAMRWRSSRVDFPSLMIVKISTRLSAVAIACL